MRQTDEEKLSKLSEGQGFARSDREGGYIRPAKEVGKHLLKAESRKPYNLPVLWGLFLPIFWPVLIIAALYWHEFRRFTPN